MSFELLFASLSRFEEMSDTGALMFEGWFILGHGAACNNQLRTRYVWPSASQSKTLVTID